MTLNKGIWGWNKSATVAHIISKSLTLLFVASIISLNSATSQETRSQEIGKKLTAIKLSENDVRIFVDGDFFAEYRSDYKGTPIVWPICAPNGSLATRAWPMIEDVDASVEKDNQMKNVLFNAVLSERNGVKDHPHHRSFWFNHGDVDRGDFWGGTPSKIRQTKFVSLEESEDKVILVTENAWFNDKTKSDVCKDVRRVTFSAGNINGKDVRIIDFSVEITPVKEKVVFGDTKEGSFGIRVPSPTAVTSKKINSKWGGSIVNDAGEKDGDTWSKRSKWVNYVGPAAKRLNDAELSAYIKDEKLEAPLATIGIAVLDGRNSLGERPWRHVRDYGLFASNPFGRHDFENNVKADGSQTLRKGETMFFNFRTIFHDGNLTNEEINAAFEEYDAEQNSGDVR